MTLALRNEVTITAVDDGAVLLDQRDGSYWQLNRTGAASLRLLLEGTSPERTAALLTERHPESADRALGDVRGLLDALRAAGLVVAS
ncbi:lasso peptide biosynthesis PqqD family chaperone [Actinokineospora sp. NBRC 105648]|uniref:lasso peptide biosynthesis PqqD family chaperone n=1 Tax=Actinokineospora sp. NBRC 105648 TaxID=3032206 RepID=UPI00249FF474|nr:lasso peptide biosynthesis PqqD family chaperone [Actinokineospora sp. NBRC 105648]GLZ37032.1 hypothetical protein Acsp05_06570 [Actinokineospora sp. NBRC 105648]